MKKIVGTIAAVALLASAAFAEVGIGSWGRGIWAPAEGNSDQKDVTSWEGISWGGNTVRTGISIHGESENVGFNIDMNADGNAAGIGDTAFFWAKPFSFLEMKMGKVQDDTGRGNAAFGIFNWKRIGCGWTGEDVTFTRFGNGAGGQANGAIFKVTPVEGLWAIACLDVQDNKDARLTFGNHAQYGIGYQIANVGHIRAQYIGAGNTVDWDGNTVPADKINVAFDLTAVEGLNLTVGAYIPLHNTGDYLTPAKTIHNWSIKADAEDAAHAFVDDPKDVAASYGNFSELKVAAGADFKISMVTLHAIFVGNFGNTYNKNDIKVSKNFDCMFGVGADFDFGNGLSLIADFRMQTAKTCTVKNEILDATLYTAGSDITFMVALQKSLSNGYVGVGFEGDLATAVKADNAKELGKTTWTWSVPVVVSAWF